MKKWESCKVSQTNTIFEVLQVIDASALQIALVADESGKLLGTVTDGDIRRAILSGMSLELPVDKIMNDAPTVVHESQERNLVITKMQERTLSHVPVVNDFGVLVDLISLKELAYKEKRENPVILMVGGLGTRLRPLTNDCPKPLLKVGNKPILETILENFIEEGFYKFYFAVNYKSNMIEKYFGDGSRYNVEIKYIHESKRMGTAGALSLITEKMDKPMVVMNGDLLTKVNFRQMLDYHKEQNALATMGVREYSYQVPYGVVCLEDNKILDIEEKPLHTFFVNAGVYVLSPEVRGRIHKEEYLDMTDLFMDIIRKGEATAAFPIREYWLDIGKIDDFEKAQQDYGEMFE